MLSKAFRVSEGWSGDVGVAAHYTSICLCVRPSLSRLRTLIILLPGIKIGNT